MSRLWASGVRRWTSVIWNLPLAICHVRSIFCLLTFALCLTSSAMALEVPVELHGSLSAAEYLNSDSSRFNMDVSMDVYVTLARHEDISLFVRYRDDLDMGEQHHGITLDPRYTHYYVAFGIDYFREQLLFSTYYMHDCVHLIDAEIDEAPVFNRFRISAADAHMHRSLRQRTKKRFLWSAELGVYPHVQYNGWDINAGADYEFDLTINTTVTLWRTGNFGTDFNPIFQIAKGDTSWYHQDVLHANTYYAAKSGRIGLGISYHLWNNDPIKGPDKLWLLSLYCAF